MPIDDRVRENVQKLISAGAAETDIDAYMQSEGIGTTAPQAAPEPEGNPGFLSRSYQDIKKRGANIAQEVNSPSDLWRETDSPIGDISRGLPEKALRVAGQVAGGVNDVAVEGVKSVYNAVMPDKAKEGISKGLDWLMKTPPGEAVKSGAQAVGGVVDKARKTFPNASKDIDALANILTAIPVGKAVKAVSGEAVDVGKDVANLAGRATLDMPKKVSKLKDRSVDLMQSATKPVQSHAPTLADKDKIMTTLAKGKYTTSAKSAEKLSTDINKLEGAADDIVSAMGEDAIIPKQNIVNYLENKQASLKASKGSGESANRMSRAIQKEISGLKNKPDMMTPQQVQSWKKDLNYETRGHWGDLEDAAREAKKDLASAYRTELEQLNPEIRNVNLQMKDLIAAEKVLDRSVGRVRNSNQTGLPTHVVLSGDYKNPLAWLNVAKRVKDQPGIKSWRSGNKMAKAEKLSQPFQPQSKTGDLLKDLLAKKDRTTSTSMNESPFTMSEVTTPNQLQLPSPQKRLPAPDPDMPNQDYLNASGPQTPSKESLLNAEASRAIIADRASGITPPRMYGTNTGPAILGKDMPFEMGPNQGFKFQGAVKDVPLGSQRLLPPPKQDIISAKHGVSLTPDDISTLYEAGKISPNDVLLLKQLLGMQ